jgi:hypothetical protein
MGNVSTKNIGLKILKQISSILNGSISTIDGAPEDLTIHFIIFYSYALTTYVNVERLSVCKNFLNHYRHYTLGNIKKKSY